MRDTKRCPRCREIKPLPAFIRPRSGTPSDYCQPCRQAKRRAEYERAGGSQVPYQQLIKREYGMTLEDYEAMLRRQAYRCAVCRRPETRMRRNGRPQRLSVDHDHVTGKVRGLLCGTCNQVVWAYEENHALRALVEAYVDQFRASFTDP